MDWIDLKRIGDIVEGFLYCAWIECALSTPLDNRLPPTTRKFLKLLIEFF